MDNMLHDKAVLNPANRFANIYWLYDNDAVGLPLLLRVLR